MKILLVQLGRIGDAILLTTIFRSLKEKFPESEIHLLLGKAAVSSIKNNPNISEIFIWDKSPFKLIKTVLSIRSNKYDYLIDPKDHHSRESRIISRLVRARVKIGFNPTGEKAIYDIGIPSDKENIELHGVVRNHNALHTLNINCPSPIPKPELFIEQASSDYLDKFLAENNIHNYIVINISASSQSRMWQKEKWIEFINKYKKNHAFIISTAPSESETANEIAISTGAVNYKSASMQDVMALVSRASMMISPDTSLVHVAAAFNIPIIGLFGGTIKDLKKFAPLSDKSVPIMAEEGIEGIRGIPLDKLFVEFDKFISNLKN